LMSTGISRHKPDSMGASLAPCYNHADFNENPLSSGFFNPNNPVPLSIGPVRINQ
jgi:hypothetical protein